MVLFCDLIEKNELEIFGSGKMGVLRCAVSRHKSGAINTMLMRMRLVPACDPVPCNTVALS
jgi:hypothetical protein